MRLTEDELVQLDLGTACERIITEGMHYPPVAEQRNHTEANRAGAPAVMHDQRGGTVAEGDALQHAENACVGYGREKEMPGAVDSEKRKPIEQIAAKKDQGSTRDDLAQDCRLAHAFV